MIKALVPIENCSWLALSAAYFAIEFAKRNPAKILVLIFSTLEVRQSRVGSGNNEADSWQKQFDELMQRGRQEKIVLELYYTDEEYLPGVSRFAREHNVTDIILAIPPFQNDLHQKVVQEINLLRHQVACQLITVKAKEEGTMGDAWNKKISRHQKPDF
jgi:hypothetical protein